MVQHSMKPIVLLILMSIFSMSFIQLPPPLPIGSALPYGNLELEGTSGTRITLNNKKKENGLLVMFSCNTCPYVINNQSRTLAIGEYADANQIGFVLINSNEASRSGDESMDAMRRYAQHQHYRWDYVVDKDQVIADAFGARRTPECFLFNRNLVLVYHGAIDDSPGNEKAVKREHLKIAIDELLSGREISIKETRSVGCSILRKKQ